MGKRISERFKNRLSEEAVAHILTLIATTPNRRTKPLPGDPEGRYDFWFDGGACEFITGWNEYVFCDGTVAQVGSCTAALSVSIRFADGRQVVVSQIGG